MESGANPRIKTPQLMSLRTEPAGAEAIAQLLGVRDMPPNLATRTKREIAAFVESGDATAANQLIHASLVRRRQKRLSGGAEQAATTGER